MSIHSEDKCYNSLDKKPSYSYIIILHGKYTCKEMTKKLFCFAQ